MQQRIAIISKNASSIQEAKILHNMLVCQVATFSPLCISMSLKECAHIGRQSLSAHQYQLKYMPSNAKHSIFMTVKKGGIRIKSFTREYIGALLRDIEVYISNDQNPTAHALVSSIEEATKQNIWNLYRDEKIPNFTTAATKASQISISGKKTLVYYDNTEQPFNETLSFDHVHTMEKAIKTACQLGFILRDLNYELLARLTDELLLNDKNAKAIASTKCRTRARQNAHIGEDNIHFCNYSILGRIYSLLQVQIEEAKKLVLHSRDNSLKLANCAKMYIRKFKDDYKLGSFYNLMEWRCQKKELEENMCQHPHQQDYMSIIDDTNVYVPSLLYSMQQNSELLSTQIRSILCLSNNDIRNVSETFMSNEEILNYATQHELPIFVSIDGSLKNESATVSVSIVAPDIQLTDTMNEWQNRPAKVLLIRSWKLPTKWGMSKTCINMAETLGFIIVEYTIPLDMPIIYITDSNNARTLQQNIRFKDKLTHCKMIRQVKQG
jgi:hypothetical protein